jgi:hypothetical protein
MLLALGRAADALTAAAELEDRRTVLDMTSRRWNERL